MRVVGLFVLLFSVNLSFASEGIPHFGLRYLLSNTDVYSPLTKKKIGTLPAHTAVLPCVVVRDGKPLVGSKGEVLLGYKEVYRESRAEVHDTTQLNFVLGAAYDFQVKRNQDLKRLHETHQEYENKKVTSMDCGTDVEGVIPLQALFPRRLEVKYTPVGPQSVVENRNNEITPLGLLKEFHNSVHCALAELNLGSRKATLLKNWESFISEKTKQNHKLKEALFRARGIDIATRTALYEGNPEEGCSEKGECEKDIIILTIKNRADIPSFGSHFPGDIVGVATIESQYNIWSEIIADMTYITSCFMRDDLTQNVPEDYKKIGRVFQQTAERAEKILYGESLKTVFSTEGKTNPKEIRHYYHPGAMEICYPQFSNLKYVYGAYASYHGKYFPVKNEFAMVTESSEPGRYNFTILKKDNKGTIDPIDDLLSFENRYEDATLPAAVIKTYQAQSRCAPYGVDPKCNVQNPVYYRTYPRWLNLGYVPQISCRDISSAGKTCEQAPVNVPSVTVSGPCNRAFSPIAGIAARLEVPQTRQTVKQLRDLSTLKINKMESFKQNGIEYIFVDYENDFSYGSRNEKICQTAALLQVVNGNLVEKESVEYECRVNSSNAVYKTQEFYYPVDLNKDTLKFDFEKSY